MIEVKISDETILKINIAEFQNWRIYSNMREDDWDYNNRTFYFKNECDALAFRLKFGV